MKNRIRQSLLFLLPLPFIYLAFAYKDYFYLVPAVVTLVLAIILSREGTLAKKGVALPHIMLPKLKRLSIKLPKIKAIQNLQKKSFYKKLTRHLLSGLTILLLAFTVIFAFITVYKLPNESESTSTFLAYFQAHFNFAKENTLLTGVLILFSTVFVGVRFRRKRIQKRPSLIFPSIFTTLMIVFLSLGLGYLGTFLYAASEVRVLSYRIKASPTSVGLVWGKNKIVEEIKNKGEAPKLVGVDTPIDKAILELTLEEDRTKSDFYRKRIVKNIPSALLSSLGIPKESLILYKNYLLVTELVKQDIEAVSPIIGKLYLKRQLAPRYIKQEPIVNVLGKQEYLKYRDEKINKKLKEIDDVIAWAQKSINILYGNIATDKQQIEANKASIERAVSKRDSDDSYCRTACYYSYYFNQCYRYFRDSECDSYRQKWDQIISQYQTSISDWEVALRQDQARLSEFLEYKKYFENIRVLVETQKDAVPYELGVFEPETSVKVVLESTNNEAVADYFATLVHEYLHYTSYISEERVLPPFFEEGLTEYFARKIIKNQLKTSTNLGYPHLVRVVQEMTKKIPEKEFEKIYFTKDEKSLIALLNDAYGSKFYKDTENYFWALTLVSARDALKFTNNIMFRIGGQELTEEDILSTYTGSN